LEKSNADISASAEWWRTAYLEERKLNLSKKNADPGSTRESGRPETVAGTTDTDICGAEESPLAAGGPFKVPEIDVRPLRDVDLPDNDGQGPPSGKRNVYCLNI
jgi:hypothetical protein